MRCGALLLLAGCGRMGFDSVVDGGAVDAPAGDDGSMTIDAPPIGTTTYTFGEAPGTTFTLVTRDTFVSNEAGEETLNFGNDDEIRLERDANERGLVGFALVAIPSAATIVSATLDLTVTQIPLAPSAIDLHRVLEPWDEGSQQGGIGVANYVERVGGVSWMTPGAGPPLSAGTAIAQFTPTLGRKRITLPASLVQLWVSDPGENKGVVLISTNDESTRFTTSEASPSTNRPVLTVTFTP